MFRPRQSNTGPKGVREDARRFYAMQKLQHQAEQVGVGQTRKSRPGKSGARLGSDSVSTAGVAVHVLGSPRVLYFNVDKLLAD